MFEIYWINVWWCCEFIAASYYFLDILHISCIHTAYAWNYVGSGTGLAQAKLMELLSLGYQGYFWSKTFPHDLCSRDTIWPTLSPQFSCLSCPPWIIWPRDTWCYGYKGWSRTRDRYYEYSLLSCHSTLNSILTSNAIWYLYGAFHPHHPLKHQSKILPQWASNKSYFDEHERNGHTSWCSRG
jgi:hypothetical protein